MILPPEKKSPKISFAETGRTLNLWELISVRSLTDCVQVNTPAQVTEGTDSENTLPDRIYVGPWCVGDTGYTDTIDIDIQPDPTGAGNDLYIWLTERANNSNPAALGAFYGIRKL